MHLVRSVVTYTTVPVTVVGLLFPNYPDTPSFRGYFGQNFLQRDFPDRFDLPSFLSGRGTASQYFVSLR